MWRMSGILAVLMVVLGCRWLPVASAADSSRIAVLELQGKGESNALPLLSDEVRAGVLEATQGRDVIVMSRENMAVLAKDMGLELSCIEGACEVETGRNIGAAYVVSGSVNKLGSVWLCTIKIHQTDTGALLSTGRTQAQEVVGLLEGISPLVVKLMNKAFGGGGPKAQVRLGGESVDFGAVAAGAAPAAPIAIGPITAIGQAEVEVGGDVDFAELARRAAQAKAVRESKETALAAEAARLAAQQKAAAEALAAERARLAEQEQVAAAALQAAQQKRVDIAKQDLLAKAAADLQQIQPLLDMELSDETRPVLQSYLKKWESAKVRVDELTEAVEVPGVAIVQQALGGASLGGTNSIGMKFMAIAASSFEMGSPSSENRRDSDESQHRVWLRKSFLMSTTEVTQGQWQAVMGSNPSKFSSCGADCPVEQISWFDAVEFANALSKKEGFRAAYRISGSTLSWDKSSNGYRLPTEVEWEYAARGGQRHVYSGSNTLTEVGWTRENSGSMTHKVAGKRANAWGLYDMSGNVWEWCWDQHGKYFDGLSIDPVGAQSSVNRVFRGGSWYYRPPSARVANRSKGTPAYRDLDLGLRLVRTNL